MKTLDIVAAVVIKDDRILIAQKPANHKLIPNKWGFPGGKTDGQLHEVALKRKLREELGGFEIDVEKYLGLYQHSYDGKTRINIYAYMCYPKNEPKRMEHKRILWVDQRNLPFYDMAEIDRKIVSTIFRKKIIYPQASQIAFFSK